MKIRALVSILIFVAICFFISCASLPRATEEDRNKNFSDFTYDQLFEAVKKTYIELDLLIIADNKDSGILHGKSRSSVAWSPGLYGEGPRLFFRYYKATFYHSDPNTNIQIKIYHRSEDGWSESEDNKNYYDAFWLRVLEKL